MDTGRQWEQLKSLVDCGKDFGFYPDFNRKSVIREF